MFMLTVIVSIVVCVLGKSTGNVSDVDTHLDGTKLIDLKFPSVQLPGLETYYVCQQYKIDDDRPYHVTMFEPILNDTSTILHHMIVFGCDFDLEDEGPHPCGNIDYRCGTWLVKWDIGMNKEIVMPNHTGVRVGKGSYKYLLLQAHFNNNDKRETVIESTGMRLHLTHNLRQHDIGNVQIGQNAIEIPAGTENQLVTGKCTSRCTSLMLPRPVYITDVYLHMHELGTEAALDIIRDREVVERFAHEENYVYDKPMWHTLDPPQAVYPGQEIEIKCWYDSLNKNRQRNTTTSFGRETSAEMCYAFIRYYPRIVGFDQCLQTGEKNLAGC